MVDRRRSQEKVKDVGIVDAQKPDAKYRGKNII